MTQFLKAENDPRIKPNLQSVLSNLAGLLRRENEQVEQFLHQMGDQRMSNPAIARVSSLIEFADWAVRDGASDSWDTFYLHVIKPLGRRDFQFIFHLGDISKKQVFEVDEVIDIIGDYSAHGGVTLLLDNREADQVWCKLNGKDATTIGPGAGLSAPAGRYGSLFKTMRIDSLVVLYPGVALHFSREGLFDIENFSIAGEPDKFINRSCFSVGYQLGLLFGLDALHRTTLGLVLSGTYPGSVPAAAESLLLPFIHDWLQSIYSRTD